MVTIMQWRKMIKHVVSYNPQSLRINMSNELMNVNDVLMNVDE